jgi:hypothetical protein
MCTTLSVLAQTHKDKHLSPDIANAKQSNGQKSVGGKETLHNHVLIFLGFLAGGG